MIRRHTKKNVIASIKYIVEQLSTIYPTSKVLVITPHYRKGIVSSDKFTEKDSFGEYYNNATNPYTLRELASRIVELCKLMGIPCLDLMSVGGVNAFNYNSYLADGVHVNALGGNYEASLISEFMLNYC